MEEALGVRLYGDETFEELMQIKETGVHPRGEPPIKKADGGQVPAAPSQLVSESDMILGYRGPGGYQSGKSDSTDKGEVSSDSGFEDRGPSTPKDLGFINDLVVSSELQKKGPNIISAPARDPRFVGYIPSGSDSGGGNIFQKGFNLVKRTVTNPFLQNVGLGILGGPIGTKLGLSRQMEMFNKARTIKGFFDQIGPMVDKTIEEGLEEETTGTDITGQTTALYRDGGLASMFVEKR